MTACAVDSACSTNRMLGIRCFYRLPLRSISPKRFREKLRNDSPVCSTGVMPGNPTENTPRGVLKPPKHPRGKPIGGEPLLVALWSRRWK